MGGVHSYQPAANENNIQRMVGNVEDIIRDFNNRGSSSPGQLEAMIHESEKLKAAVEGLNVTLIRARGACRPVKRQMITSKVHVQRYTVKVVGSR